MNENKSLLTRLGETLDQCRAERRAIVPESAPPRQPGRLGRVLRWFVPNGGTLLLVGILILTANVWAKPLASPAPGPSATTVNYQGRLADPSGNPKNGTFGMTFALYDAPSGGSLVWGPESHAAVPVSDGLFSVGVGSQTSGGIPTSAWNGDRYLEITVGGETLSPRELIRSVPIAGMALTVPDGAVTTPKLALTYDGYNTWLASEHTMVAPGWTYLADQNYRNLSATVNRAAFLDVSLTATLRQDGGGRASFRVLVDGNDVLLYAYHNSTNNVSVSSRALVPVEAGTHTVAVQFGSWDSTTVTIGGPLAFNVVVYGR